MKKLVWPFLVLCSPVFAQVTPLVLTPEEEAVLTLLIEAKVEVEATSNDLMIVAFNQERTERLLNLLDEEIDAAGNYPEELGIVTPPRADADALISYFDFALEQAEERKEAAQSNHDALEQTIREIRQRYESQQE